MSSRGWPRKPLRLGFESLEDRVVPTLLGNALFPADNPWNQKIANAPVATNSATLISSIGASSRFHADFGSGTYAGSVIGIPYNVVSGTQPKVPVVVDYYPDESDLVSVPIPEGAIREGDPLPAAQNNGDRHVLIYDKDNNIVYELYAARRPSENADGKWHAGSLAVWDLKANSFRTPGYTSADAAGLPILPGLVNADEVFGRGVIDHAIRFTVPRSASSYVFPASHHAGSNDSSLPRMGERFRLKQSFDISGFSAANKVILQAMKDYGLIVADNGSPWYVSGNPDPRWDNDDLHRLDVLVGSNFEAVDLRPRATGLSAAGGPAGSTLIVSGLNFSGGAGRTQVTFGGTAASVVVVNSDTSITVTVPPGVTGATVDVVVVTPYGTTSPQRFTYGPELPPPPPPPPVPAVLQFAVAGYSLRESGRAAVITVTRTGNVDTAAAVGYGTANGTAAARQDYQIAAGRLSFAAGETRKTFTVAIFEDALREANETIRLLLVNPSPGAVLGTQRTSLVTIIDNDWGRRGTIQVQAPSYGTLEGGTVTVTLTRTGGSDGAVAVLYQTIAATALAGVDFVAARAWVHFADGQMTRTFTLRTLQDTAQELSEHFRLVLSNPVGGAVIGTRRAAWVRIDDDDIAGALASLLMSSSPDSRRLSGLPI